MKKYIVIEILDHLPDEFRFEKLVEKLLFIEKVEQGTQEAEVGKVMSLQEARQKIESKWESTRSFC